MNELLDNVIRNTETNRGPQIHVRFQGRSFDIPLAEVDIGALSTDEQVKSAVANHLEVPNSKLSAFVVDRSESGDLTLRPDAVFA